MQQDRRRVPIHTATELQGAAASGSSSGDARATRLSDDGAGFETRAFREVLGHYASGITIITGVDDGGAFGFTCQSFHSVSVDPPVDELREFALGNQSVQQVSALIGAEAARRFAL